ncbi:MAG: (E)-4-hydroxy-3-methylbut-2-enyl-diphosphate synthase [Spirochaetes bacterium]|nr:(E)-4-hydroxy-3-methylbut-2-enyl-diphosphate synthase [Spirochaetota bacterium]
MGAGLSKTVKIGGFKHIKAVFLGGDSPVAVQTMWKDRLSMAEVEGGAAGHPHIIERIDSLGKLGCSILRFSVPDMEAAEALGRLAEAVSMPLVADIHFDHKIALRCLDFPIAKLRINPGNIGGREKVRQVLEKAAGKDVPIRIGVNGGSLPLDLRRQAEAGLDLAQAMFLAAKREIAFFEEFGFASFLVSIKASGIADTVKANRIFSQNCDAPLHLGLTEAGPLVSGTARSAAALAPLLAEGIGDTVRVSLSDSMENELIAGREILGAAAELAGEAGAFARQRLATGCVKIISCPRCGRCGFDTHGFTSRWLSRLYALQAEFTVAIMGCEVNGPQEAKHADLGITGAGNKVLIFRQGKVARTVSAAGADMAFEEEIGKLLAGRSILGGEE